MERRGLIATPVVGWELEIYGGESGCVGITADESWKRKRRFIVERMGSSAFVEVHLNPSEVTPPPIHPCIVAYAHLRLAEEIAHVSSCHFRIQFA